MSNLDAYHPFRASVNTGVANPPSNANSNTAEGSGGNSENKQGWQKEDDDKPPRFSWKTKFRLLIGGFALSFLVYIGYQVNSYFDSKTAKASKSEPSMLQEMMEKDQDLMKENNPFSHFDKNDLNERGRTVESAREKAGFLKSILCRGGKSSRFCE